MDFATVFTAFKLDEAQLVCSRPEAANFHPVIINEYSTIELCGGGGGVVVQLPEAEAADAREFLAAK
jgi:hypothetical protein